VGNPSGTAADDRLVFSVRSSVLSFRDRIINESHQTRRFAIW
jgi:hypothetical protein